MNPAVPVRTQPPILAEHSPFSNPPMPDPAPNAELLRSLGRLVRGLSALFWGLPLALIVGVQTAKTDWFRTFGALPAATAAGLLLYGLWQIGQFQKQERPWQNALDRAKLLGLINLGLSPFLFWWNRAPSELFFAISVLVLTVCATMFLINLNTVLHRLSAMLPDETLRQETKQFTALNRLLLLIALVLGTLFASVSRMQVLPVEIVGLLELLERQTGLGWFIITVLPIALLVLLPLAMTMALLWKIKEVILDNVFNAGRDGA